MARASIVFLLLGSLAGTFYHSEAGQTRIVLPSTSAWACLVQAYPEALARHDLVRHLVLPGLLRASPVGQARLALGKPRQH